MKRYVWHIAFFIFLITLITLTYKDYGVGWDENANVSNGLYYLNVLCKFFGLSLTTAIKAAGRMIDIYPNYFVSFIPNSGHLKEHGVLFDILTMGLAVIFNKISYEFVHLIKALTAVSIFLLIMLTVNKILNKKAAFLAAVILLLFPRFYGHIFFSQIDVPSMILFSLTVFSFIVFIESNQDRVKQIVLGLIMALAISQRVLFWYLLPVNFIFLYFISRNDPNKKNEFWKKVFLITGSLLFFVHLFNPYLIQHPGIGILQTVYSSFNFPWKGYILFTGREFPSIILPWYYLPLSMAITIPLITLALFVIGNLYLIYLIKIGNNFKKKIIYCYLLTIFYLPILLVIIFKPVIYDSWRQFTFLAFPMVIIAAYGFEWISKIRNRLVFYGAVIIITINFLLIGNEMIRLHPYEYLYFNSLVGGLKGAYGKYETDYWGLGYKEAVLWFEKNIDKSNKKYKIYVEGNPISSYYYFKPNMELVGNIKLAQYIIVFTRENLNIIDGGKTIHIIKKEGIPLIYIKQNN